MNPEIVTKPVRSSEMSVTALQVNKSPKRRRATSTSLCARRHSRAYQFSVISLLRPFLHPPLTSIYQGYADTSQAHALLATPEKELSAPLPKPLTTLIASLGSKLRLDAPYVPPQETPMTITPQLPSSPPPSTLTLPLLNPLPLISYALTIADEALYVSGAEPETKSGELDWYTRRLGLALIYLHAETHLLRPRPAHSSTDPQIPLAMRQLDESLARYRRLSEANARLGEVEKQMGQFGWFVWKSWGGLFRSRGWIN